MNATLGDVDAETAKKWLDGGEAVLVDVREPGEHARERIPGSTLLPLSGFDPADYSAFSGKRIVIHCASGKRSRIVGARLLSSGVADVFILEGDVFGWRDAGFPTETG